jgi:hypothetical protein
MIKHHLPLTGAAYPIKEMVIATVKKDACTNAVLINLTSFFVYEKWI